MFKSPKILLSMAVFILLGVLALGKPMPASAAVAVKDCKQWHTVKHGEYLSQIARLYGTDYLTLADINDLEAPYVIFPNQQLCVSLVPGGTPASPITPSSSNIFAASVKEDISVTLQGKNLAASTRHSVYLSNERAKFTSLIYAGVVTTDKYGTFKVTYNIPKKLVDVPQIRITLISATGTKISNWFYNATLDSNTGGVTTPAISIVVDSSKVNQWVKIKVSNLPVKMTFDVFIGKEGSKGLNGVKVGTLSISKSGSVTASFDIPDQYLDRAKLDIRLENKSYGIVSTLTFANKNK